VIIDQVQAFERDHADGTPQTDCLTAA